MIFQTNFQSNSNMVNNEIRKICEQHLGCADCPLKEKDLQIEDSLVRCDTGRNNV